MVAQTTKPVRRTRRRIAIAGVLALVAGVLTVIALTAWVANRALVAKDSLQAAQGQLTSFKSALGQPNAPSTAKLYSELQANTTKAADQVDDPIWSLYEHVPKLGPNLIAFRQTATLVNTLVHDGVGPLAKAANGISVDSLKPHDGGLDIEPLKTLTPAMADVDDAIGAADASAGRIDTDGVVPQLKQPIASLQDTLQQAKPVTAELRKVMPVLYPALGGEGTRHYLLMFQNNAEERASGGNPASMAMLVVKDGKISLGRQAGSKNFPAPYAEPQLTFKGDWDKVYGFYTSSYVTNITMTPDFPQTAKLAKKMWTGQFGGKVDGVISFDPVALSYLLKATGPIKLADGKQIDSDNAVSYLLYDVYAKYTEPAQQDLVFASAAQGVFKAVTNGQGKPSDYVAQLKPMLDQQRLKMWSDRSDEQDLLMTSQMGNMLPDDNSKATVLGVYNNDDSTSKMSYFMDQKIHVVSNTCQAKPKYTVSATVKNTLPKSRAYSLPDYVKAHQNHIDPGGDRQWVQIYGPVGAKLSSATIDGQKVVWGTNYKYDYNTNYSATGEAEKRPAVKATMYGRPVGVVSINMGPEESREVKATFIGGDDPSDDVQVSSTPKVHDTPVEIDSADCK